MLFVASGNLSIAASSLNQAETSPAMVRFLAAFAQIGAWLHENPHSWAEAPYAQMMQAEAVTQGREDAGGFSAGVHCNLAAAT